MEREAKGAAPPAGLAELVAAAKIVSFDFFDTLFVRTVLDPEDVFDLVGRRLGLSEFRKRRKAAQTRAFAQMHRDGRKEITLEGIYKEFGDSVIAPSRILKAELEAELAVILHNPEVSEVYRSAIAAGKKVVITSDMYLPKRFFTAALKAAGLPVVPILASSDMNATKRDHGELYERLIERFAVAPSDILHIGDNPVSDIERAAEKGLRVFHYVDGHRPHSGFGAGSVEVSLAKGLVRRQDRERLADGCFNLGFAYGGPTALSWLAWLQEQTTTDDIQHVLLLARDGYLLSKIAETEPSLATRFHYFPGSRTAYTLASITAENFAQHVPFLLAGAEGLAPQDVLTRLAVPVPAEPVMRDIGLGPEVALDTMSLGRMRQFLFAYRAEIIKVGRENRRALFTLMAGLGIRPGDRVGIVDVGWHGTTQDALEAAIAPHWGLECFGYYLCLADSPQTRERAQRRRMRAFIAPPEFEASAAREIHASRLFVELLFSAPHHSIVGLKPGAGGAVEQVYDPRRTPDEPLLDVTSRIIGGAVAFAESYRAASKSLWLPPPPKALIEPLLAIAKDRSWKADPQVSAVVDFDDWGLTRNVRRRLVDY